MILADTSIWIDHLRDGDSDLVGLLNELKIVIHPFILGEIACGRLVNRGQVLRLLNDLPGTITATDAETLQFIERWKLMGLGIGYIDAHLLAAVSLTSHALLWTRDKRLHSVAEKLDLAYQP